MVIEITPAFSLRGPIQAASGRCQRASVPYFAYPRFRSSLDLRACNRKNVVVKGSYGFSVLSRQLQAFIVAGEAHILQSLPVGALQGTHTVDRFHHHLFQRVKIAREECFKESKVRGQRGIIRSRLDSQLLCVAPRHDFQACAMKYDEAAGRPRGQVIVQTSKLEPAGRCRVCRAHPVDAAFIETSTIEALVRQGTAANAEEPAGNTVLFVAHWLSYYSPVLHEFVGQTLGLPDGTYAAVLDYTAPGGEHRGGYTHPVSA